MTPIHHPKHSQLSRSPVCCCCIPIKFIVLVMQAAALISEILFVCNASTHANSELLIRILLIVYIAFTFAVFFFEHKGLMTLHCALYIALLSVSIIVPICYYFIYYPEIKIENIFGKGKLVEAFICIIVNVVYIAMCCTLIKALEKKATLPSYVATVQPSYNSEYDPERFQPIYPLL